MTAYRRVDDCGMTAVHRDQLRAQRSVTSMGSLYLLPLIYYCITSVCVTLLFDLMIAILLNLLILTYCCFSAKILLYNGSVFVTCDFDL